MCMYIYIYNISSKLNIPFDDSSKLTYRKFCKTFASQNNLGYLL